MIIWPDHREIDSFIVQLTTQEMQNILEGLEAVIRLHDSPWMNAERTAIKKAIKAQRDYRFSKFDSEEKTTP